jgi:hypothetical protein
MDTTALTRLTDTQLVDEVQSLAARERAATAELIAALAEVDGRRLHLGLGYPSMFAFCTARLRLSESAAYARIEAARVAGRFPLVLDLLLDGSITLTTVSLLAPHLTVETHDAVLRAAIHKSKREVEMQVAALRPLPPAPVVVRKLPPPRVLPDEVPPAAEVMQSVPAPMTATNLRAVVIKSSVDPPRRAIVAPLAPERFKVQLTISRETHAKLRRVQDLMRHSVPDGDLAVIVDRALSLLLEKLEKQKCASVTAPTSKGAGRAANTRRTRHVPASVAREVWKRDGSQCTFVGTDGRCPARAWLELHHIVSFANGGAMDTANLTLRCRAHNQYEAEQIFGPWSVRESTIRYSSHFTGSGPSRVIAAQSARACYDQKDQLIL